MTGAFEVRKKVRKLYHSKLPSHLGIRARNRPPLRPERWARLTAMTSTLPMLVAFCRKSAQARKGVIRARYGDVTVATTRRSPGVKRTLVRLGYLRSRQKTQSSHR